MYTFYQPNLVIVDPDIIQMVLTKEFWSFNSRGTFCNEKIDPLSAHLFSLPGKKWWNLRVKLTPTFTSGKMKQMFPIMMQCSENLLKNLTNIIHTNNVVDIKEVFANFTTDTIMSVAFGIESNCLRERNNEFRHWRKKIMETSGFWNTLYMFVPQVLDFFSISNTNRGVEKFFIKLFRDNIEYREDYNVVRHDFMNLLIQLMEKGYVEPDDEKDKVNISSNTNKLTMLQATAQAFVFFIAGFETSSSTATYCLYELAQNQDIQDKVRQEIDETLKKYGELTHDAMNEMTYLHKIIKETTRKYPSLPSLNRVVTEDIVLPMTNVHLPKGTSITIPVFAMHRDPALFPDPDKFDPERFNPDQVKARRTYTYMPFGGGPRQCIGSRFGYMQTKIGVINVISNFKFKLHPRTPIPLVFDPNVFLLIVKDGVHFILEPR
ncbi:Cytochrome P450 6a2 [Harpegnathos saltator]|uniref:Cytochrome P450 6a2 n=2 Tax=Harpegnathos saltator TaxID=610380 RepID=E2B532_HARSA|nr:Cytochrome P450 6a2 [Harpegnathos saltator]